MAKGLIEWADEQPVWVSDSLRRIASAANHALDDEDFVAIAANIRNAVRGVVAPDAPSRLEGTHLGNAPGQSPRTVLAQLGPLQNVDRLAAGQTLRMAPDGVTLIYGENGSGKSGYTRIAKHLCRSLSVDRLKGNVFEPGACGPMRVQVRYRTGEREVETLDWDPSTPAPPALRQISVFDSQNARLYVDGENRIAYLPREVAILEHHGDLCQRLGKAFEAEEKALGSRLKVPLPAGYTKDGEVARMLARLDPKSSAIPAVDELQALSRLSSGQLEELHELERELAADPVAMAETRRKASALLKRVCEVLAQLDVALSVRAAEEINRARQELAHAIGAERIAATLQLGLEPVARTGGEPWRILYDAARAFASEAGSPEKRLPDNPGELCLLCQEPLSLEGAGRLARFNDFVAGEATRRADGARQQVGAATGRIFETKVPDLDVVAQSLTSYGGISPTRQLLTERITSVLSVFASRRTALLNLATPLVEAPAVAELANALEADRLLLENEAARMQEAASHTSLLDGQRSRLAHLIDRQKLALDIDVVVQRRKDAAHCAFLKACSAQVSTRQVSLQITAMRSLLVTEELQKRVADEIVALDLGHLPFGVKDLSAGGQSLFSVGLMGAGKIRNDQILSEGEQRALALACFLAEVGGEDARYGVIVDDPVSSLDHTRLRKVARRLVQEAGKGRQVIIFTHNLVFFNEMVSQAGRGGVPVVKSVVRKTSAQGFGVIQENSEPWVADLNSRISTLRDRVARLKHVVDFDTDDYRRQVKDFYSDLRESWERAVEELVLNKTVQRFDPEVMTQRLKNVSVTDEDYRTIYFAMKNASERSGHDMSAGRNIAQPFQDEMAGDLKALDDFRLDYGARAKARAKIRAAMEGPGPGQLI